jgi:hypothetical protein
MAEGPLARNPLMQMSPFDDGPVLGALPWTNGGALFAAWEDDQRTFGREQRTPDIVGQLLPLPIVRLGDEVGDGGGDANAD